MHKKPGEDGTGSSTIAGVLSDISSMISALDPEIIHTASKLIADADLLIAFGNGGSQAIASHLVGDLLLWPGPKVAISIGDNTIAHSAYANDYSFEEAPGLGIERIVSGRNNNKTVVILFSTSGESKNVVRAARRAKEHGCTVVAMLGKHLHRLEPYSDLIISVPGVRAGRIEAVHDAICHAIAEVVRLLKE